MSRKEEEMVEMTSKTQQKSNGDENFQPYEVDRNFLMIDDEHMKYFRELKEKVKIQTGLTFTYNKLLKLLLESVDRDAFEGKLKVLKDVLKGEEK